MKMYRIRDKETGEFWKNKGRSAWHGTGPAKNAWNLCRPYNRPIDCLFDEQSEHEIVEFDLKETRVIG